MRNASPLREVFIDRIPTHAHIIDILILYYNIFFVLTATIRCLT